MGLSSTNSPRLLNEWLSLGLSEEWKGNNYTTFWVLVDSRNHTANEYLGHGRPGNIPNPLTCELIKNYFKKQLKSFIR